MKVKTFVWAMSIVLVVSLVGVAVVSATDGGATLVVINFVGAEMIFTLDGVDYFVPGIDVAPEGGQLELDLAPGRYTYSAHVPGAEGSNGEVELATGETYVLGGRIERSGPVVSPTGIVLEKPKDMLVMFEASLEPAAPGVAPEPTPLQPLPSGQGALVFVNYIGEALTVDIGGTLYQVPANDRLQINLPPGEVGYSLSAGRSGFNGSAQVTAGKYSGLAFTREIPPEEADYDVGDPVPTPVPLEIFMSPVVLADEPVLQPMADSAPPATEDVAGPSPAVAAGEGAVTVINYIGEPLTFTIDGQQYAVAAGGGELRVDLAPGDYTFTAATPRSATNGDLSVAGGSSVRVSVALDAPGGSVKAYIE